MAWGGPIPSGEEECGRDIRFAARIIIWENMGHDILSPSLLDSFV